MFLKPTFGTISGSSSRCQKQYRRSGKRIRNTLQTNGTLLDNEWAEFFKAHDFLIGLSLDGTEALHDGYRVDRAGRPSYAAA